MVTDLGNGQFRCEKCNRESGEFKWRYILRGAIADATGYQWITLFDDSASKVIGKSAQEMAVIKEHDGEIEFRKQLHRAKYRRFNLSGKASQSVRF